MRVEIIIAEILESMKITEEYLPDDFEEFKRLGIIKDGIYKRTEIYTGSLKLLKDSWRVKNEGSCLGSC